MFCEYGPRCLDVDPQNMQMFSSIIMLSRKKYLCFIVAIDFVSCVVFCRATRILSRKWHVYGALLMMPSVSVWRPRKNGPSCGARTSHSKRETWVELSCACVCACVRVCVRVRACVFMWFMRTQICIMTWVWQRYYNLKVFYEDTAYVPVIQNAYKSYRVRFFWGK